MPRLTDVASNDNDDLLEDATKRLLALARKGACDQSFGALERALLEVSNEALRRAFESVLQELATSEEDVIEIQGSRYRRHERGTAKYHSLCGPISVERWTYRLVGVRNGPTVVPLELRAGLIQRATPALAFAITQGYAKSPIRSVRLDLEAAHRAPPSRATMERMGKAIGTEMKRVLMPIERGVRAQEPIPKSAVAITLGLDRTSVPMEEDDANGPNGIVVHYRMAYVGTVALTNRKSEVVASWKYATPACEGSAQVVRRMMNDLRSALAAKPKLHIGVVQDGAYDIWATMIEAMRAELGPGRRWHKAIDMYHLMERLSRALEIVEPDETKRSKRIRMWKRRLLRDNGAIAGIARFFELDHLWLRSERTRQRQHLLSIGYTIEKDGLLGFAKPSAKRPPPPRARRWNEQQAKELSRLLWLYLIDPNMFRYARIAAKGLHVGSGVTEGACKSLIAARAKRSGQRWRPPGITAVLTVRSLLESNRLPSFWKRFARRHALNVLAA